MHQHLPNNAWHAPLVLITLSACNPNFALPQDVEIGCVADNECPRDMTCLTALGRCVQDSEAYDLSPPEIVAVIAQSETLVVLSMNEAIQSVEHEACTVIDEVGNSLPVFSHHVVGQTLNLGTATQWPEEVYSITCLGLEDLSGNIAATISGEFLGFGLRDTTPADLIAPAEGAVALNNQAVLVWSARIGARFYRVQLSNSTTFGVGVVEEFLTDQTSLAITLPAARTYYWRVVTDSTADPESVPGRRIEGLADTAYVYCPASVAECDDQGMVGNESKPMRTIQGGISVASVHGLGQVKVATRAPGETTPAYVESISLVDGISVHGGYTYDSAMQTISDEADVAGNQTRVKNAGLGTVTATQIHAPTVLSGFDIFAEDGAAIAHALYIANSGGNFVIRDNTIVAGAAVQRSVGVLLECEERLSPAERPLLLRNEIRSGTVSRPQGSETSAVLANMCGGRLIRNNILAGNVSTDPGDDFFSLGIYSDADIEIEGNIIVSGRRIGGPGTVRSHAILLFNVDNFRIWNNVIVGRAFPASRSSALRVGGITGGGIVEHNTLVVVGASGMPPNSVTVMDFRRPTVLRNNLIVTDVDLGSAITSASGKIPVLQHNVFVGPYPNSEFVNLTPGATCICPSITAEDNTCLDDCVSDVSDNTALATAEAVSFVLWSNEIGELDLRLTPDSPDAVKFGAVLLSDVLDDLTGVPRTCTDDGCVSVGAYEQD